MSSPHRVRVDHIGSFARPPSLLDAARAHRDGKLDDAGLIAAQDDAIRHIVKFQESIGLPTITDGEFRRRGWSAGFIDAVEGFGMRNGSLGFRTDASGGELVPSPYAKSPIKRKHPIVADDFRFLSSIVRSGAPKTTIAAPDVMHFFLGPQSYETSVYPDREAYLSALTAIYRSEVAELAAADCRWLQLDDTALACNCDGQVRADVVARGESPDELTGRYVDLFNDAIAGRPANMTVAVHLCRGNLKGKWMADGGYDPVADALFNRMNADVYYLEYDTERAGGFEPLRLVPKGKAVILGLMSTKTPVLESKDALKRRLDEAARFIDIDQLGISPQCGFSSAGGRGQVVTEIDTRAKLERLVELALEVWGSTGG
jgi:5-methyltetrahydropteroyltriglutamate--homocysteine methyltransferase